MTFSRSSPSLRSLGSGPLGVGSRELERCVRRCLVLLDRHHPAAGETSFAPQIHRALGFQHVERLRPELEAQDVAFPRQQVVVDVHPGHRLQVAPDDAVGDEGGGFGVVVPAVLDVVQGLGANRQPLLVLPVPVGHPGVEIPAVVVEAGAVGDGANLVERLVLDHAEADDDVRDLDAGVVDVVLHLDGNAAEAEHADQGVAKRGVPEMTDVCGLVRVDRRVLDDRLARCRHGPSGRCSTADRAGTPGARERR